MKKRIISAVVLIAVLIVAFLFVPAWVTAIVVGLLSAVASWELMHNTGLLTHKRVNIYSSVMAFSVSIWSLFGCPTVYIGIALLLFFGLLFGEMMFAQLRLEAKAVLVCGFSGLVIPYMFTALLRIAMMEQGRVYIFIPFLLAFLTDTGGYFAGITLGRHKLCPLISPKKTVEGLVGGLLASVAGMVIFAIITDHNILFAILLGVTGALAAIFGDLSMSVIKRQMGIKDYGHLIPGHGGVLDRFDSVLVTAPLTETMLLLFFMV